MKININYLKKNETINTLIKIFLAFIFFVFLSSIFKILDSGFIKFFSLNKYLNVFDFILFGFGIFIFIKKEKFYKYFSLNTFLLISLILLSRASILFSNGQIHHKSYLDLFRFSTLILVFLFFLTPFFKKNKKIFFRCFFIIFFTFTVFESSVAILQFILQRPLGFTFLNEPFFNINDPGSAKIFISGKALFLKNILISENGEVLRAHGTFIHPNVLSGFLNISSLLTLYLIFTSKKKFLFTLFLFFQIVALILTFSRAGMFALFVSTTFFFILMMINRYEIKKTLLSCFALTIISFSMFFNAILERGGLGNHYQSDKSKELNFESNNLRQDLKDISINMIKKHPFFGVGFRNFLIKKDEYTNKKIDRAYVHNIYLAIASETGLFALAIFLVLILSIFYSLLKYRLDPFLIILVCILCSFLIIGFFDHYPISSFFGKIVIFSILGFLNYDIQSNKLFFIKKKKILA